MQIAAITYIDVFRALPILVVLILIYYALPFVGISLSSFTSATLALSLVLAAFTAEVCRAGIENIPKGQFEAAAALGLPFLVALRKVILPQALRVVVPPLTSNCVSVFKDTALASVVAMPDLLKQATDAQALMANPTPLVGAALIYLAFLWPLVRLVSHPRGAPASANTPMAEPRPDAARSPPHGHFAADHRPPEGGRVSDRGRAGPVPGPGGARRFRLSRQCRRRPGARHGA